MSVEAFEAAINAASAYVAAQRPHEPDDQLDRLSIEFDILDPVSALTTASALQAVVPDVEITLTLDVPSSPLGLTDSGWRKLDPSVQITEELEALRNREEHEEWSADDLVQAAAQIRGGVGRLKLSKHLWRHDLETELNRTVWIGPRVDGFEMWLRGRQWSSAADALLTDHPGAAVLVSDWKGPPRPHGRLVVGRPGDDVSAAEDDGLAARLVGVGRDSPNEFARWRTAMIDPGVPVASMRRLLRSLASSAQPGRSRNRERTTRQCALSEAKCARTPCRRP